MVTGRGGFQSPFSDNSLDGQAQFSDLWGNDYFWNKKLYPMQLEIRFSYSQRKYSSHSNTGTVL